MKNANYEIPCHSSNKHSSKCRQKIKDFMTINESLENLENGSHNQLLHLRRNSSKTLT